MVAFSDLTPPVQLSACAAGAYRSQRRVSRETLVLKLVAGAAFLNVLRPACLDSRRDGLLFSASVLSASMLRISLRIHQQGRTLVLTALWVPPVNSARHWPNVRPS